MAKFARLPVTVREKTSFVLKAVLRRSEVYYLLSRRLRADKDVLLKALSGLYRYSYSPLKDAPASLRDDIGVMRRAVKTHDFAFKSASKRIRTSLSALNELIRANELSFRYLSPRMRANKKLALIAVKKYGSFLELCPKALRADKEIVKAALSASWPQWGVLGCAHDALRDDSELVRLAIRKCGGVALFEASRRLREDPAYIKIALRAGVGAQFSRFPPSVRADRELCLLAVQHSSHAFIGIDESLKDDTAFCISAVHANNQCLNYIPSRVRRRSLFRKDAKIDLGLSARQVREGFLAALETYEPEGSLSGRGHVPRVTLNGQTAAALRGLDLPKLFISGYGANWHYPRTFVKKAAAILGVEMGTLTGRGS